MTKVMLCSSSTRLNRRRASSASRLPSSHPEELRPRRRSRTHRAAGALLADAMLRVFPGSDAQQVTDAAFLIWHLGEATMRLAISCAPDEGRRLVEAFKRMSLGEIMAPATMSTFSS